MHVCAKMCTEFIEYLKSGSEIENLNSYPTISLKLNTAMLSTGETLQPGKSCADSRETGCLQNN